MRKPDPSLVRAASARAGSSSGPGRPEKGAGAPSMLWELVFLSITVLRPHLANDLTAEPNTESIALGRQGVQAELLLWELNWWC